MGQLHEGTRQPLSRCALTMGTWPCVFLCLCPWLRRAALEKHGMSLALGAMWAANVVDIQRTLHSVCKRLLREPNMSKEELKKRAQVTLAPETMRVTK
jgi:hypothetical protein